jgi:DNA polymerase III delta prime subunit
MRTEIIEKTYFTFDELSEEAKEAARKWYRELDSTWEYEEEYILEDCKDIAKNIGIDIDKIYYSGFSSQGDGACFTGSYRYKSGSVKAIREDMPNNIELNRIVGELASAQKKYFYGIQAVISHSYRYYFAKSTDIRVEHNYNDIQIGERTEERIQDALTDFMDWIYKRLQDSYFETLEDEYIEEAIIANDYEFTEDGEKQ